MSSNVTYKYIRQNPDIHTYIKNADAAVKAQGYTEHSFAHVEKVADTVKMILEGLGYDERKVELGMIAAYLHDIGNVINRIDTLRAELSWLSVCWIILICLPRKYAISYPLSAIMTRALLSL